MTRKVRRFSGSVYYLGLHEEFWHLRSKLPTLWSSSYFLAPVGAVSTETERRYTDAQGERSRKRGDGL